MQSVLETKGIKHALDIVGGQNKYQIRATLIIAWQYLFRSFFLIYYAYLTQPPIFLCRNEDDPNSFRECTENNGGCLEKILAANSPSSLVNDLELYCEKAYIRTLGGSLFFVGGNIGVAFFSYLSDYKGRKAAMMYSYLLGSASLFLLGSAATGPLTYVLFLMLVWGSLSCYVSLSLTYVAEFANESFTRTAGSLLLMSITIGQLIIIGLAYLFSSSWQSLYLCSIGIPAVLSNVSFMFLDESPVFLYSKKETTKTIEVLKKIALINEKPLNEYALLSSKKNSLKTQAQAQTQPTQPAKPVKSWNYLQIILHPKLRVRVLIYSMIRLYLCMAYFGAIFALSSLGGNIYTNSIIAAVAEFLGYALSLKSHLFPARILLKGSLLTVVITGISFLAIPVLSCDGFFICQELFLQGFLSLVMRTAVCFIYGFIYTLGNEIFPTEVRGQANGIGGVFSDLGGMIAPIVLLFCETNNLNPLFMFGVLGFSALASGQYLPEDIITNLDEDNNDTELGYLEMVN